MFSKKTQRKTFVYMFVLLFLQQSFQLEIGSFHYLFPFMDRVIFHEIMGGHMSPNMFNTSGAQDSGSSRKEVEAYHGAEQRTTGASGWWKFVSVVQVNTSGRYDTTRNSKGQQATTAATTTTTTTTTTTWRKHSKNVWVTNNQSLVDALRQTRRSKTSQVVTVSKENHWSAGKKPGKVRFTTCRDRMILLSLSLSQIYIYKYIYIIYTSQNARGFHGAMPVWEGNLGWIICNCGLNFSSFQLKC